MTTDPDEKQKIEVISEALQNLFNPYGVTHTGFVLLHFSLDNIRSPGCISNVGDGVIVELMREYIKKHDF